MNLTRSIFLGCALAFVAACGGDDKDDNGGGGGGGGGGGDATACEAEADLDACASCCQGEGFDGGSVSGDVCTCVNASGGGDDTSGGGGFGGDDSGGFGF